MKRPLRVLVLLQMPERLPFASKWSFLERTIALWFRILSCGFFMLCSFPFRSFTVHSLRNRIVSFRPDVVLKEKSFEFAGKRLEHLESREVLCVRCPKNLVVSAGPGYKTFKEWIRYFYNNVIDRLFEATSQSINDRRVDTLRLDTNQLPLIRGPTVH